MTDPGRSAVTPPALALPAAVAAPSRVESARDLGRTVASGLAVLGRSAELAGAPGRVAGGAVRAVAEGLTRAAAIGLPQVDLSGPESLRRAPGAAATVRYHEDDDGWVIRAQRSTFRVDGATGHLVSWSVEGRALLRAPLRPNYWRALTDNDRGYGNIDRRLQHVGWTQPGGPRMSGLPRCARTPAGMA